MASPEVIQKIREGLTPLVSIVGFKDLDGEIQGEVRYEMNGFGYPVINQVSFRADLDGNLLSVKEDVGRHNAIDKVIGEILFKKLSFNNVFLTSTGRLTGDSVLKAIRAKIPIVASFSAGIESGIRLAFAYGITLIGFIRGGRMNIYTHPERMIL